MKKCLFVVLMSLAASAAQAQSQSEGGLSNISFDQNRIEKAAHAGERWSMYAADTMGDGENAFGARFGWPDLTLEFLHGLSPSVDIGGEFQLSYAFEGTTLNNKVGIGFLVPFRVNVYRGDKLSVLLHVDPGIKILTGLGPAKFGLQAPVGAAFGFRIGPSLQLGFAVDLPFAIYVTGNQNPILAIPPIFGPFLEYHIDKNVVIGFDARFGVLFYSTSDFTDDFGFFYPGGSDTQFAFRVQLLLGYRL